MIVVYYHHHINGINHIDHKSKNKNKKSVDWNVDINDIEHTKSNSRMGLTFEQNKMLAKSMTDLFVANQMNKQPNKKGKKGKNNTNPMKEYHTNKVFNQLETDFGSLSLSSHLI
eukprot:163369_1